MSGRLNLGAMGLCSISIKSVLRSAFAFKERTNNKLKKMLRKRNREKLLIVEFIRLTIVQPTIYVFKNKERSSKRWVLL